MSSSSDEPEGRCDPSGIDAADAAIPWAALEAVVHLDPAGRGLASFRREQLPLDAGQLRAAALDLARTAGAVGIVTGFCVKIDERVAAEIDGPPGALFLARALAAVGAEVTLMSDAYALPLLSSGCELWGLDRKWLLEIPLEDGPPTAASRSRNDRPNCVATDRWVREFLASPRGRRMSHLIAVERPGPSHTTESLLAQKREGDPPIDRFTAAVREQDRDVCHNVRGESINAYTAKSHRLFEAIVQNKLPISTIGVGDGGNEIGMGRFDWETMAAAIGSSSAGRIVTRIATDYSLIAGVSNWAAYALALAVVRLRGATALGREWNSLAQRELIEHLVENTSAVDGLTRRREPSVDGLPLDVYLRPLDEMRSLLGYADAN